MPKKFGKRGGKRGGRRYGNKKSKYLRGGSGRIQALKTLTVPDKLVVKLPYSTQIVYGDALGIQDYIFNLNSIYDPDRTGVGHQPLGYDQWNTFYNRYRVLGAKVTVRAFNNSTIATGLSIIGNNSAGLVLGSDATREQPHIKSMILGNNQGGKNVGTMTKYFSCSRVTGASTQQYRSSDQYQALFGASPTEVIVAHIYQENMLPGAQASGVMARVDIVYYVELFDRNTLALSNTAPELRGPENNQGEN